MTDTFAAKICGDRGTAGLWRKGARKEHVALEPECKITILSISDGRLSNVLLHKGRARPASSRFPILALS